MRYTSASIALLASAGLTSAGVVKARADCQAQADACRIVPGANQSFCSAQLSSCLGYNPYTNNTASVSSTAASVHYTTVIQSSYVTYCPYPTTVVQGSQTYTVTAATTLTITNCPCTVTKAISAGTSTSRASPQTSSAAASSCVASCQATYNTCRVGTPGMSGNQASCLAAYASCLGFLPTNAAGSLTSPTACSTTAAIANTSAGRTDSVSLTTTVRPAQTIAVPVCQIGDGQLQNNAAGCTTVSGRVSTVTIPATTMTIPIATSAARPASSTAVVVAPVPSSSAARPASSTAAVVVPVPSSSATRPASVPASGPASSASASTAVSANRPVGTGLPVCQIGDGQLQNAGGCTTAATAPAATTVATSSSRSVQQVATTTTARTPTQFTGAASIDKPVYGLLAMGAFAALL